MNLGVTEQSYGFGGAYIRNRNQSRSSTCVTAEIYYREMPEDSRPGKNIPTNQESAVDIYNRMRHSRTLDIAEEGQGKAASEIPDDGISKEKSSSKAVSGAPVEKETPDEPKEEEEAKSDSDIIVKPDGSRVLVMTITLGGMKTSMSLEISGPTAMVNDRGMGDETSLGLAVNL